MKKAIFDCINLQKLRQDYWDKVEKLDDIIHQKNQILNTHFANIYNDKNLSRICSREIKAKNELDRLNSFISEYLFTGEVKLKTGGRTFTLDGHDYTIKKEQVVRDSGWTTKKATIWRLIASDGVEAPYHNTQDDTKTELIEWVNRMERNKFMSEIVGFRNQKKK